MIRVNDRVVVRNRAGTVYKIEDVGPYRHYVRFDDDGHEEPFAENEIIVVSSIPVRVTFAYNVGERVRWDPPLGGDSITTYITERVELEDAPAYKLMDERLSGTYAEHQIAAAPLPNVSDDDMEDLIAQYLRRGISYMSNEAARREFDNQQPMILIEASGDYDKNVSVKFTSKYGWSPSADADTLMHSINECIRRNQADKDNTPKKLPHLES